MDPATLCFVPTGKISFWDISRWHPATVVFLWVFCVVYTAVGTFQKGTYNNKPVSSFPFARVQQQPPPKRAKVNPSAPG